MAYDRLFGFDTTQKATLTKWLKEELAAAGVGGPIAISDVTGLSQALSDLEDDLSDLADQLSALSISDVDGLSQVLADLEGRVSALENNA